MDVSGRMKKAKVEGRGKAWLRGRFGAGLPAASDGQMLFLMTAISKMKDIVDFLDVRCKLIDHNIDEKRK